MAGFRSMNKSCYGSNEICKGASDMMLYQEIRQRCRMYHQYESRYDGAYGRYIVAKNQDMWDNPVDLDYAEVNRLVAFLNQWNTMMPSNGETIRLLLKNLKTAVPCLNTLRSDTLLDVNFDETTKQMIAKCFDTIAESGIRRDGVYVTVSVGASKMLNVAINPELFVMWDREIQSGHDIRVNFGSAYAHVFLPKMQRIAKKAVKEVVEQENLSCADAIQSFTDNCEKKNSLAKIIDEYNFTKFTKGYRLVAKSNA